MAQNMKISVIRESGENIIITVNAKETFQQFQNRVLRDYDLCLTKHNFTSVYPSLSPNDNLFNHLKRNINIQRSNDTNNFENMAHMCEINLRDDGSQNMSTIIKLENSSPYVISDESMEVPSTEPYNVYTDVQQLNSSLMNLNQTSNTPRHGITTALRENIFVIEKGDTRKKPENRQHITLYGENDKITLTDDYHLIKNNPTRKHTENKQERVISETRDDKLLVNNFNSEKCSQSYTYMDIESKLREIHSYNEENLADFCRLCAVNIAEENKVLIYTDNNDGESVHEKINGILPIIVGKEDGLPQQVCQSCSDRLGNFYDFVQMVVQADKVIRLKFTNVDNSSENLKETVSDFMSEFLTPSPLSKISTETETNKNVKFESQDVDNYETEYLDAECNKDKTDSQSLKCRMCDLVFDNFSESVSHSFRLHNAKGVIACSFCEYGYSNVSQLTQHIEACHQKNFELRKMRQFQCNVCSIKYTTQIQLEKHTCTKTIVTKTLHCEICNQSFPTKVRLNFHRQFHVKDAKPLYCSLCDLTFDDENEYFDHVNFNHETRQVYVCDYCDKTFSVRSALNNHKKIHTGIRNYKCDLCDKSFLDKQTLTEHKVSHMETKPYQCHVCGKNLNRLSRLRKHLLTHESNPVVNDVCVCALCKEAFPDQQIALLHQIYQHDNKQCIEITSTDKVFRCEFCEKCYSITTALNDHRIAHTGPTPYTCHICKAQFSSYSRCTTHKTTHGLFKDGAEKDNNYPVVKHFLCEHCGKSYLHWTYLGLHRRLKHSENVHIYKCNECNLEFPTSWGIAYHRKSKHNQDQYKCPDCGKQLSNFHSLKLHRLTLHANSKSKDIQCHKCGKIFVHKTSLEAHLKSHEGIKEYKCNLCTKSFVHPSGLSNHYKLHRTNKYVFDSKHEERSKEGPFISIQNLNLDRPYTCDVCGLSFRKPYILRNHKQKHNSETEDNSFVLMVDMKEDIFEDEDAKTQKESSEIVQTALDETQPSSSNIQLDLTSDNPLENYIDLGNGNFLQIQGNTFNIDGKEYVLIDEDGKQITRNQFEMIVDEEPDQNNEIIANQQDDINETIMLVEPENTYTMNLNEQQSEFLFATSDSTLSKSNTTYVIGNQFMLGTDDLTY